MGKRKRVERPRNAGTWTEAQYWGAVRSILRNGFKYWRPITQCKNKVRRKYKGKNKRQKWEYQCAKCKQWFKGTEVQVDHITPVGSLKCYDDIAGWLQRLTVEDGFQVLCKKCHQEKTNKERQK